MAAIAGKYDQTAPATSGFEVMPEHDTVAQVVDSDVRTTQDGSGEYIYLKWEIIDGEFKGRWIFENYNIKNKNTQCQQIGNSQWALVRKACFGSIDKAVSDTVEVHGIPCKIKVGCRKRKDTGDMQNHIKAIHGMSEPAAATSTGTKKPF